MTFFTLLNNSNGLIVYVHAIKNFELIHQINCYLQDKKTNVKLSLVYSSDEGQLQLNNKLINFYYSQVNFEPALLAHNQLKDRLGFKFNLKEKFVSLYEKISLSADQVTNKLLGLNKKLNVTNLSSAIQRYKNENFTLYPNVSHNNNITLNALVEFVNDNISWAKNFNFKEFFNIYSVPKHHRLFDRTCYKTVVFENVYYRNKGFYNKDGSFFDISEISKDIEYRDYNKTKLNIDTENAIQITEPTLFLDYIYDFYNFGEFWDVVQRILSVDVSDNIQIFGLNKHKVSNIEFYFNKCNLTYPPAYIRDFCWKDVDIETNKGSTFFFKKLYFSTIKNTCRGALNPWVAFMMNNLYNTFVIKNETFKIYLSRGKEKRGIVEEERFISKLTQDGFIVLDGSESLHEQMFYFTNASLIIGVHGSLMKNIVWCKQNPIFIELFPPSRASLCFAGNAEQLNFKTIAIPCDANEEEQIILSDDNINNLCEFISIFM